VAPRKSSPLRKMALASLARRLSPSLLMLQRLLSQAN
jgi:hypothetical protein